MTIEPSTHQRFTVLMPMKPWDRAKSRLHHDPHLRRSLADAFARDTLEAVLRCPEVAHVVVVTRGDLVLTYVRSVGAIAIQEPTERPLDTLGSAVRHGIAWAWQHHRGAPLAVIPADLPALTPSALSGLLRAAHRHPLAFVRDASGDGTTILTSRTPAHMVSAYGVGSADRHLAAGAVELTQVDAGLRRDVDVLDDLVEAKNLGLGPHTTRTCFHLAAGDIRVTQ